MTTNTENQFPQKKSIIDQEGDEEDIDIVDPPLSSSLLLHLDQIGADLAEAEPSKKGPKQTEEKRMDMSDGKSEENSQEKFHSLSDPGDGSWKKNTSWNCTVCSFSNEFLISYCHQCHQIRDIYQDDPEFVKAKEDFKMVKRLEERLQNHLAALDSKDSKTKASHTVSPPPPPPSDVMVPSPGSWACDQCTLINPISVTKCSACGKAQFPFLNGILPNAPLFRTENDSWNCPHCTFQNRPSFLVCEMCDKPRDFNSQMNSLVPKNFVPSILRGAELESFSNGEETTLHPKKRKQEEENEELKKKLSELEGQVTNLKKHLTNVTEELVTYKLSDVSLASPSKKVKTAEEEEETEEDNSVIPPPISTQKEVDDDD